MMQGFEVVRRTHADGSIATWISDHDGREHPFVYDLPVLDNNHVVNGVRQWNWLWISELHTVKSPTGDIWPVESDGKPNRVSIWSGPKGRWLDGDDPNQDANIGGDFRGFPIPALGKTSVVSLGDVDLWIVVDNGFGPA